MDADPLLHIPAKVAGDDFEEFFWGLLRRKYQPQDLVYLPAQLNGDHGIEGFSSDGIAYQCYADQDSLSLRARTDKQKSKLYDDTEKLKKNASKLEDVLGGLVLTHYFLCVLQYHAAELVQYAEKRAAVVRGFGLPFIAPDFCIRVKTPDDYPAEYQAAILDGVAKSSIPSMEIDESEVGSFGEKSPELSDKLDSKLAQVKAVHATANTSKLREVFIRAFLDKEEILAHLRSWPESFEAYEIQRQVRQEALELESALNTDQPQNRLSYILRDFTKQVEGCAGVTPSDAGRLARGQTGEWLMRCPMSFDGDAQ